MDQPPRPHREETATAEDGTRLHVRIWAPPEPPIGTVVLVHGLGEHGGRYGSLISAFLERGIAVWAQDHRGHGRSGGLRGVVRRWRDLGDDLLRFIDRVRGQAGDTPVTVYGHSMGGAVVLDTLAGPAGTGLAAIAASAPPLIIPIEIPVWKRAMAPVVATLFPWLALSNEIEPTLLSRDPAMVEAYLQDPLVHHKCSARLFLGMLDAGRRILMADRPWACPLLLIHGTADGICAPEGSRRLHERARAPEKAIHLHEGCRHECHNDIGREEVAGRTVAWLAERLAAAPR